MDLRAKGFTLLELLIALAVLLVIVSLAVPAFSRSIQIARADADIDSLQRGLGFARLEAINRGTTVRVRPMAGGDDWSRGLSITEVDGALTNVLRVVPAPSRGAALTLTSGVETIEFNSLGGLAAPSMTVLISYALGAQGRVLNLCLNGRIQRGGSCG
jgi:type IV fimbrial biogenesis protein FimU